MNQFTQAADFFSKAFDAQSRAATIQQSRQQPDTDDFSFYTEEAFNPTGSPVPPKFGGYGQSQEDEYKIEEVKKDMLQRSLSKRNGSNGVEFRAGGGLPTQSPS